MNTPETKNSSNPSKDIAARNLVAPSVTIAPRNPARGVLTFIVTLTDHKTVRSYPCRTPESALKLATNFIASVLPKPQWKF